MLSFCDYSIAFGAWSLDFLTCNWSMISPFHHLRAWLKFIATSDHIEFVLNPIRNLLLSLCVDGAMVDVFIRFPWILRIITKNYMLPSLNFGSEEADCSTFTWSTFVWVMPIFSSHLLQLYFCFIYFVESSKFSDYFFNFILRSTLMQCYLWILYGFIWFNLQMNFGI